MEYRVEDNDNAAEMWLRYRVSCERRAGAEDCTIFEEINDECERAFEALMDLPVRQLDTLLNKLRAVGMEYGQRGTDLVPADLVARMRDDAEVLLAFDA